jgi:hypothetical protein
METSSQLAELAKIGRHAECRTSLAARARAPEARIVRRERASRPKLLSKRDCHRADHKG